MENKVNSPSAPIESALDLLGRRWALRVVWELRRDRLSFGELSKRLAISPSVLTSRLGELVEAGICEVEPSGRGYSLTGHGRELARILYEVNRWASADSAAPSTTMLNS
jgi:DNA-binding HxlR family transcriptional regulator